MLHIALQIMSHEASVGFAGSMCDQLVDHAWKLQQVSRLTLHKPFSTGRATLNTMVLHNVPLCAMLARHQKVCLQIEARSSHGLRMLVAVRPYGCIKSESRRLLSRVRYLKAEPWNPLLYTHADTFCSDTFICTH